MADLDFLDTIHPMYTRLAPLWRALERRGWGSVALDLMKFPGESPERLAIRQDRASYVNFMKSHGLAVTGNLRQFGGPDVGDQSRFSFGALGPIRPAEDIPLGRETPAEAIVYNVDGLGANGMEWAPYWDSVDIRAQITGHRVMMAETPPITTPEVTLQDVRSGVRVFYPEYSPLEMTMWADRFNRWEFVILRVHTDAGRVVDGKWENPADQVPSDGDPLPGRGYYLLVREGTEVLGAAFREGGFWLYGPKKNQLDHKPWGPMLRGQIPLWLHYGERGTGTTEEPRLSHSPTAPLGNVGVSLMDMLSCRDWDALDAARSGKWFLGANAEVMGEVYKQWEERSLLIGVPPAFIEQVAQLSQVTLYDDSAGAVAPAVFQAIIEGKFAEAREQSFQALTSLPGSSGIREMVGFAEVKAPYLTYRASLRQQSEQTAIYFGEARMGQVPQGFARWKRVYTLQPLVDDIDRAFQTLRLNGLRAPALEAEMAIRAIKDRLGGGLPLPPDVTEEQVRTDLVQSGEQARTTESQASQLAASFNAPAAAPEPVPAGVA